MSFVCLTLRQFAALMWIRMALDSNYTGDVREALVRFVLGVQEIG